MKVPDCHPERKYLAKGLCQPCYHSKWNKETKLRSTLEFKHRVQINKLKCTYGLSKNDYLSLLKKQNYKCAICQSELIPWNKGTHVDHCHITNIVRGLLCHHCNLLLGNAKDNINVLKKAIEYLMELKFR